MSSGEASSSSGQHRSIFPGFLATNEPDHDYALTPNSPRSENASPQLSYLPNAPAPRYPQKPSPAVPPPKASVAEAGSSKPRRRPPPLELHRSRAIGLDEELEEQRESDALNTALTAYGDESSTRMHEDMQDLSLSTRNNLSARPSPSVLEGPYSDGGNYAPASVPSASTSRTNTATILDLVKLLQTSAQLLIVDTRPVGSFLESHLPRSANISIPSLIFKRFRKSNGHKGATWESLSSFVTTPAGKEAWRQVLPRRGPDVVLIGVMDGDETAEVLRGILEDLLEGGSARILRGGWPAVQASPETSGMLVSGELSQLPSSSTANTQTLQSAPSNDTPLHPFPPHGPSPGSRISARPSMPSLRVEPPSKPEPSTLSIQTSQGPPRRPPKLSLNLDRPLRSATLGSFPHEPPPKTPSRNPQKLSINIGSSDAKPPHLSFSGPKSPSPFAGSSFQTLVHAQSKLPPSPSSFGDVRKFIRDEDDLASGSSGTLASQFADVTARPGTRTPGFPGDAPRTAGLPTSRAGMAPFIISTILPSFLFLGPEITTQLEVDELKRMGIKRILNVALECNDDEGLDMGKQFDRYYKIPMRDIVEESGVGRGMKEACDFLDDARLHSSPTYVHCKAGKSRSVTVVLAYLIHANAWTLKTSYAYVAARRKGISPNIGFVAELMQFEEAELGLKQSGGVHGESSGRNDDDEDKKNSRSNPRHMRESLPPAWASSSLDSRPPKPSLIGGGQSAGEGDDPTEDSKERRQVRDEREVRKNGQWVQQRRAPVDRTTLQPGRRVSKAGLESLRPLESTRNESSSTSPNPLLVSPGNTKEAITPGTEGRLGWV